jgi:hypothetical protein
MSTEENLRHVNFPFEVPSLHATKKKLGIQSWAHRAFNLKKVPSLRQLVCSTFVDDLHM